MAHYAPSRIYHRFHLEGGYSVKEIMAVLGVIAIVAMTVLLPEYFDRSVDELQEQMIEDECHRAFADDETSRLCTGWVSRQFDECFESKELVESPAPHRTYDKLTPQSECRQELIEKFATRRGEPIINDTGRNTKKQTEAIEKH